MSSLWGISKNELSKELYFGPSKIVKDQIEIFDKMTKGILIGHLSSFRIKDPDCEYSIGMTFEIIAPNLNGYRYRIFSMYTKPVDEYPVLIFNELEPDEDSITEINADYVCNNENEFTIALGKILKSDDISRVIKVLFSKSMI